MEGTEQQTPPMFPGLGVAGFDPSKRSLSRVLFIKGHIIYTAEDIVTTEEPPA